MKIRQPSHEDCLNQFLFKPIRVPFLPVSAIPDHLIDPILRTPAKFTLSLRRVRLNDRSVAGTAVINDIRNLDAIHTFKGFNELQNAVALPCSQVIRNQATIVLDRLKSVHVASGEVYSTVAINPTQLQKHTNEFGRQWVSKLSFLIVLIIYVLLIVI